jgi:hypothetical protein
MAKHKKPIEANGKKKSAESPRCGQGCEVRGGSGESCGKPCSKPRGHQGGHTCAGHCYTEGLGN